MAISSRNTLLAALAFIAFQAQAVNVTVAYQTSAEPAKVAQADNTFAKESGATVDWRKFDSGASIVRALASGDVQIGNLGSSPLAVAASQQVSIEVFLLASKLGNSEALVVKKTISKLARLSGVPEGDVPGLVKGNTYLTPQQQTAELTGPVNKAIIDTAQFLKEQGKVPAVANDYSQYVTSRFVQ
ncbi:glycine betaine ABC transporter substrate-binding protein [Escherichia coli]|uniref:glycine betaine ABC transporter substrate-binding protein n=1 Tax=Escherichia coli TaxID=562 RepID=UPI0037DD365B